MDLRFNVVKNEVIETVPKVMGVVIDNDRVQFKDSIYPISEKSKSIRGLKVFYVHDVEAVSKEFKPYFPKTSATLIHQKHIYLGENKAFRAYKTGSIVLGRIKENKFVINVVKHNTYGVETSTELQVK